MNKTLIEKLEGMLDIGCGEKYDAGIRDAIAIVRQQEAEATGKESLQVQGSESSVLGDGERVDAVGRARTLSGSIPDSPSQQREISVVNDFRDKISNALECANLFVLKHCDKPKAVEVIQAINAGRDALRLCKPVSQSDTPVNDTEAMEWLTGNYGGSYELWVDPVSLFNDFHKLLKPVSVSLEKCLVPLLNGDYIDLYDDAKKAAKAVLDAAGVKYVD